MENIFKIKREERWPSCLALLYVVLWNALVVYKYADRFFALNENYRKLFIQFHISGFDPISYMVISNWDTSYNIYRHPLLAFFMFLPNQLNQVLIELTGINWATIIMGLILTFCAFYSFVFLVRIFHEIIGTSRADSWLLVTLTFSFGYVIVGMSVPDHFCLSMFMLILTLYLSGRLMKAERTFTTWQTIALFFVTAGISLNNGIKVFIANLFVNGKHFWRPTNLIFAIIVPSTLIWLGARLEWQHFERPKYLARVEKRAKTTEKQHERIAAAVRDTTHQRLREGSHSHERFGKGATETKQSSIRPPRQANKQDGVRAMDRHLHATLGIDGGKHIRRAHTTSCRLSLGRRVAKPPRDSKLQTHD